MPYALFKDGVQIKIDDTVVLSIKRLRSKGIAYREIANRFGADTLKKIKEVKE